MNSTIIESRGFNNKKKGDHELISGLANIKLVRLQHHLGFLKYERSMRGFQGGTLELVSKGAGKKYQFRPHTTREGRDVPTPRPLVFAPDKISDQLVALIPLTKFNKKFLAAIYYNQDAPKILDHEADLEIKQMAEKFKVNKITEKTQSELIAEQSEEIAKLRRAGLRKDQELNKTIKNQNTIADAMITTRAIATEAEVDALRIEISEEVYEEKADLVSTLLEQYSDDWMDSDEYKEGIAPEIVERLEVKLKEKGISKDEND